MGDYQWQLNVLLLHAVRDSANGLKNMVYVSTVVAVVTLTVVSSLMMAVPFGHNSSNFSRYPPCQKDAVEMVRVMREEGHGHVLWSSVGQDVDGRAAGRRWRGRKVAEHAAAVGVHEGSDGVGLNDRSVRVGGDEGVDFEGGSVAQHHLVVPLVVC